MRFAPLNCATSKVATCNSQRQAAAQQCCLPRRPAASEFKQLKGGNFSAHFSDYRSCHGEQTESDKHSHIDSRISLPGEITLAGREGNTDPATGPNDNKLSRPLIGLTYARMGTVAGKMVGACDY